MPLLGIFSRKDRRDSPKVSKGSSRSSTTSDAADSRDTDFVVLPSPHVQVPALTITPTHHPYLHQQSNATQTSIATTSTSKFKNPFRRLGRSTPTLASPPSSPRKLTRPRQSIDRLTVSLDNVFQPPPRHSSLYNSPVIPTPSASTRPSPEQNGKYLTPPGRSTGPTDRSTANALSWHGERPPPRPLNIPVSAPAVTQTHEDSSFNLKSFRHIQPGSPASGSESGMSPAPSSVFSSPVPRPRGGSMASDTSQRISVAAFREAQARRSSTNIPSLSISPSNRSTSIVGLEGLVPSRTSFSKDLSNAPDSTLPLPNTSSSAPVQKTSYTNDETSSESSSDEEDESDTVTPSPSVGRLHPGRPSHRHTGSKSEMGHGSSSVTHASHHQQTTSTRSEIGHDRLEKQPQPSTAPAIPSQGSQGSSHVGFVGTRSFSLYRRDRASYSTSELDPNATVKQGVSVADSPAAVSTVIAKPIAQAQKAALRRESATSSDISSSSSSGTSSSDEDDDDAPLATLVMPPRPGTSASNASSSSTKPGQRTVSKPLIDLNAKFNKITGKPLVEEKMEKPTDVKVKISSPTNISARLQQLTAGLSTQTAQSVAASQDQRSGSHDGFSPKIRLVDAPMPSVAADRMLTPDTVEDSNISRKMSFDRRSASVPHLGATSSSSPPLSEWNDAMPPRPIPIHEGVAKNGFEVVSRPARSRSPGSSSAVSSTLSPRASTASPEPIVPTSSFAGQIRPTAVRHRPTSSSFSVVSRPVSTVSHMAVTNGHASSSSQHNASPSSQPLQDKQPSPPLKLTHPERLVPEKSHTMPPPASQFTHSQTHPVKRPAEKSRSVAPPIAAQASQKPLMDKGFSTSPTSTLKSLDTLKVKTERPFAAAHRRRESPESSVGGSSTSKAPLTPADGSDYFSHHESRWRDSSSNATSESSSGITQAVAPKNPKLHQRRISGTVTFEDEVMKESVKEERSRPLKSAMAPMSATKFAEKEREREPMRRERRRSEAMAAIELGKAVNGKAPPSDDDEEEDEEDMPVNTGMGPRMQMMNGMINPTMMPNFGPRTPSVAWPNVVPTMPIISPQQFMIPPPPMNADPAFLAAHQQAMLIAKQTYQYTIAQQALNAANEEWERSSNMTSFGGGISMAGINAMGGMPMGRMSPGWMPTASPFFSPPAPQSMYAGSFGGASEMGHAWETATAYGEPYGRSFGDRRSQMFGNGQVAFPSGRSGSMENMSTQAERGNQRSKRPGAARQRTKTAPSTAPLPTQHANHSKSNQAFAPPSSWKPR